MPLSIGVSGAWKNIQGISIGVGGVWKPVQAIWIGVGGVWKKVYSAVSLSISPSGQFPVGNANSTSFGAETISSGGDTPSAYSWSFTSPSGGTWSVSAGQGTASATAVVTGVGHNVTATATLVCTVTLNGTNYTLSAGLSYTNTGAG